MWLSTCALVVLMQVVSLYCATLQNFRSTNLHRTEHGRMKRATFALDDIMHEVGALRETDLILVIDRSDGMGKDQFYASLKHLIRRLLTQYASLHPDYVRMAGITFAKDSTVVFDHISSNGINAMSKAAFFPDVLSPTDPWYQVEYISDENVAGTNLPDAFTQAGGIMATGRVKRPGVKQVVLVLTDGDFSTNEDPVLTVSQLWTDNITIFGVVSGNWLNPGSVRSLCNNQEHYAHINDWLTMLRLKERAITADTPPLWYQEVPELCSDSCPANSQCYSDINTGYVKCRCDVGYTLDTGNTCTGQESRKDADDSVELEAAAREVHPISQTLSDAKRQIQQCIAQEAHILEDHMAATFAGIGGRVTGEIISATEGFKVQQQSLADQIEDNAVRITSAIQEDAKVTKECISEEARLTTSVIERDADSTLDRIQVATSEETAVITDEAEATKRFIGDEAKAVNATVVQQANMTKDAVDGEAAATMEVVESTNKAVNDAVKVAIANLTLKTKRQSHMVQQQVSEGMEEIKETTKLYLGCGDSTSAQDVTSKIEEKLQLLGRGLKRLHDDISKIKQ